MAVIFLFLWLCGALFVGAVFGSARTIGFWGATLLSIIFSPLIGLIISLFFPTHESKSQQNAMLRAQQATANALINQSKSAPSISDELTKLKGLKDEGVLTEEEFDSQKKKLLEKK